MNRRWSSNLVAVLATWPAIFNNCARSKGQGYKVTYKKITLSGALELETLESKRPLIVVGAPPKL